MKYIIMPFKKIHILNNRNITYPLLICRLFLIVIVNPSHGALCKAFSQWPAGRRLNTAFQRRIKYT